MKLLFPKSFERQSKLSHVWQSLRVTDTPAQRGLVMLVVHCLTEPRVQLTPGLFDLRKHVFSIESLI